MFKPVILEVHHPCESHDCQKPGQTIVIWTDGKGDKRIGEIGVVFSPTGVRHAGCPDPHFATFLAERELSEREASEAITRALLALGQQAMNDLAE